MKNFVLFFAFLFSMPSFAICIPHRDEIKIKDDSMRFSSIIITDSKKVLLVSKFRNENLEFDCSDLSAQKAVKPNGAWTAKAQFGLGKTLEKLTGFKKDETVKITNTTEFPIVTEVRVEGKKLIVKDSSTDRSFLITCHAPQGVSVQAIHDKKVLPFYSRGSDKIDTVASDSCSDKTLSIDIVNAKVEFLDSSKSQPILKAQPANESSGAGVK
jgi:hypothetical protein